MFIRNENCRVNTKLWNHGNSLAIALPSKNLRRRLSSSNSIGSIEHVAFDPANRQRVTPEQVLPRKKHRPRSMAERIPAGYSRRKVVRLLINVHHIRTKSTHKPFKRPKPIHVIVTIETEAKMLDVIRIRFRPFSLAHAAILNPTFRHRSKNFNICVCP